MKIFHLSLVFSSLLISVSATFQPSGAPFKSPVTTARGVVADVVFSNLTAPRGITFDSLGNLLVVERGFGLTVFSPATGGYDREVVIPNTGFTHGIQVDGTNLYVSTGGSVILYDYNATSKSVSSFAGRVFIDGIPADGELTTHTLQLEFNSNGAAVGVLVGSGPLTNIDKTARDPTSGRSQIRRFPVLTPTSSSTPQPWSSGRIIAYGIRNPGGFAFSPASAVTQGLYIVENGASIDNVTGLTPTFVNDNPADELNIVAALSSTVSPKFFGFPDCSTLWNPQADPSGVPQYAGDHRGDQFSLHLDLVRDDQWCRNAGNNAPPKLSFQAHSVPLDIKFYLGPQPTQASPRKPLPTGFIGDSFVSFHGSFDRNPPTGYGVVHVPRVPLTSSVLGYEFIVQTKDLLSCPGTCIRPVGLAFGKEGRLFVSSDSSGELFVLSGA